jgi:hypothetical protein
MQPFRHFTLLAALLMAQSGQAEVPAGERQALVDLYHSTHGGVTWDTDHQWLVGDPCDNQWPGVHCTANRVTKLDLSGVLRSGTLPESIGQLTRLEHLDLTWSGMIGVIPESITNLTHLKFLLLSNNHFHGSLPQDLSNMTALGFVELTGNRLTGKIPQSFTELDNLQMFFYEFNGLYPENAAVQAKLNEVACNTINPSPAGNPCPSLITQVLPPEDFRKTVQPDGSLILKWEKQRSIEDMSVNGYELWIATEPDGPYQLYQDIGSWQTNQLTMDAEMAEAAYDIAIRTYAKPYQTIEYSVGRPHGYVGEANLKNRFSEAVSIDGQIIHDLQFPLSPTHSGSWSDPNSPGQGLVLEVLSDDNILIYWYTFDAWGQHQWWIGNAIRRGHGFQTYLTTPREGLFPPGFVESEYQRFHSGMVELYFTNENTLAFSWDTDHSNLQQFTRSLQTAPSQNRLLNGSYSGSWYAPDLANQGLTVEVLPDDTGLIYWYTFHPFDPVSGYYLSGPLWILGSGTVTDQQLTVELYTVSGPQVPPTQPEPDIEYHPWGTATLNFADCNNATFSWQPNENNQAFTAGQMPVQRLTSLAGQHCTESTE